MNAYEWAKLRKQHEANDETLKLHRSLVDNFLGAAEKDELSLNHPLHEAVLNEKKSLGFDITYRVENGPTGEKRHHYHFSVYRSGGYGD